MTENPYVATESPEETLIRDHRRRMATRRLFDDKLAPYDDEILIPGAVVGNPEKVGVVP